MRLELNSSEVDNILVALEEYAGRHSRYEVGTRMCIDRIRGLLQDTLTNANQLELTITNQKLV